MRTTIFLIVAAAAVGAQTFEVASVKPSARKVGIDYRPVIEVGAGRFSAHNASLKDLIRAAWHIDRYQLSGGPAWIDDDEFDVDAKADGAAAPDEIRLMLRALVTDRFSLALKSESKEVRRYALVVDRGGPKIKPAKPDDPAGEFHGDMRLLANLLSLKLSMPAPEDPTKPVRAIGAPVPVLDQTGLSGVYNLDWPKPELGLEPFVMWQRFLQERAGLRLDSQRGPVEMFVVESARKPGANE